MNGPRITHVLDPERAVADLAREHQVLAGMTGADSARIDALVGDVGTIKGSVQAVNSKVDGVASGVNELRDALAILVRHDVEMSHNRTAAEALRVDVNTMSGRVQVLERQIGPVVEMRGWVIGGGLAVLGVVGLGLVALVMRAPI